MPDWDENSAQLRANLAGVLREIHQEARERKLPTLDSVRRWHTGVMAGLDVPDPRYVGSFRGERGLEKKRVAVGSNLAVEPADVVKELEHFETKLQELVKALDEELSAGQEPNEDQLSAIIDVCAWVHAEWARIHPFVNGNGRTARLWANSIAMRYDIDPFIRLRPRPDGGYGLAGARAMQGDWRPTAVVFRRMLNELLDGAS